MRVVCLSEPRVIIRIFTPNVRMLNLLEEMKLCQQTDKNKLTNYIKNYMSLKRNVTIVTMKHQHIKLYFKKKEGNTYNYCTKYFLHF